MYNGSQWHLQDVPCRYDHQTNVISHWFPVCDPGMSISNCIQTENELCREVRTSQAVRACCCQSRLTTIVECSKPRGAKESMPSCL